MNDSGTGTGSAVGWALECECDNTVEGQGEECEAGANVQVTCGACGRRCVVTITQVYGPADPAGSR